MFTHHKLSYDEATLWPVYFLMVFLSLFGIWARPIWAGKKFLSHIWLITIRLPA